MRYKVWLLSFCATVAVLGAAKPARAQADQNQDTVETVTVTAERRGSEDILSTPMAVDAFSGQLLERVGVQSLQDLSRIDPSLQVQQYGVNQEQIFIRGISSNVGQTTGVYVDEAPLKGGFNSNIYGDNTPVLAMHDVERVEVLKGPQGTLFGTGSMDGTVRVITNKPDLDDFGGMGEGSVAGVDGGDVYFDGSGVLNVPIVKGQLGVRLVAWGANGGGFIDQTIDGTTRTNVNDQHMWGGRGETLWEPTSRFSLLATVNYQDTRVDGSQSWTQYVGALNVRGGPETGPYPAYQNHSPTQEPYDSRYLLATVTGQYDLDFGSIIATSSYGNKNELFLYDGTPGDCSYNLCAGSAAYPAGFSAWSRFADYTDEIRFSSDFAGPVQLVAGAYYDQDILNYNQMEVHANLATGIPYCYTDVECNTLGLVKPGYGNSPVQFATGDRFRVNQYALYGQVDWKIIPSLTATLGARYFSAGLHDETLTQQNISPTQTPNGYDGGYVLGDITVPYVSAASQSVESKPTFNFSLLWQVDPNISLYARAASGFRIGGINESAIVAAQEGTTIPGSFGPDSLWDYEGGIKAYFLDQRLFFDLSVYHIDWSGQQESAVASVYDYTINVGSSSIDGLELSSTFRPTQELTLSGSVTYVDAALSQNLPQTVVAAGTPGVTGDRMPYIPRLSISGQGEYDHPLSDTVAGYLQSDFTYHGNSFSAFQPSTPAQIAAGQNDYYTALPSYFLLDLRAGIRFDQYDLSVYAQNVTNSLAVLGVHADHDGTRIYPAAPLTVGVHLAAHF
jgi:iron complex outermembrane recepter protein